MIVEKTKETYKLIKEYTVDDTETRIETISITLEVDYENRRISITGRENNFQFKNFNHFNKGKVVTELVHEAMKKGEELLKAYTY